MNVKIASQNQNLKITVKTLSKYNKWEQRCSQRNKQIDSETQKVTKIQAEKHTK